MSSLGKRIRSLGALSLIPAALAAQTAATARPWVGKAAEIEEFIRTAPVVRMEDVSRGVTRPNRAYLAPGGPVDSIIWKVLPPRRSNGFFESYKSEIAAYEIDKLLVLEMVPPKVERQIGSDVGVAVMWVGSTKSFADLGGVPNPPPAESVAWSRRSSGPRCSRT